MIFNVSREKTIIPKFCNNDKAKESEQIKVKILKPTVIEREELVTTKTTGKAGQEEFVLEYKTDTERIMKEFTPKIVNFSITDSSGQTKEITTGKELMALPGFSGLVDEICNEVIREEVDQITAKN